MRSIIKTASEWNQFHLSDDEYEARATVQKQEKFLGYWIFGKRKNQRKGNKRGKSEEKLN